MALGSPHAVTGALAKPKREKVLACIQMRFFIAWRPGDEGDTLDLRFLLSSESSHADGSPTDDERALSPP